jgi:hypothetical protein
MRSGPIVSEASGFSNLAPSAISRQVKRSKFLGHRITLMSTLLFQLLHFCEARSSGEDAQTNQTSHPPNPGEYFTLPS